MGLILLIILDRSASRRRARPGLTAATGVTPPSGGLGLVLLIIIVLLLMGRIPMGY